MGDKKQDSPVKSLRSLRSLLPNWDDKEKPKTGIAHVAHASSSPPTMMRISPVYNFTPSMASLVHSNSEHEVRRSEFADTDSSSAASEEEIDAETIYSIIEGYDQQDNRQSSTEMANVFHESFSGSSPDSSENITSIAERTEEKLPDPDVASQKSLSSGELLGKLEAGIRDSRTTDASKYDSSFGSSNENSNTTQKRFSLTTANLTAGIDSRSKLPFTLYTVQDKQRSADRAPKAEIPPVPSNIISSDSANESASDSGSGHGSKSSCRSGSSERPAVEKQATNPPMPSNEGKRVTYNDISPVSSPETSVTHDNERRRSDHLNMFSDNFSDILEHGDDLEKAYSIFEQEHVIWQPWIRWFIVMVMGLVAVPVYFFLFTGFLDREGPNSSSVIRKHLETEKNMPAPTYGYHRRYTRWQKILSLCIGITWICIVLAMIPLAFGLRARFHR